MQNAFIWRMNMISIHRIQQFISERIMRITLLKYTILHLSIDFVVNQSIKVLKHMNPIFKDQINVSTLNKSK